MGAVHSAATVLTQLVCKILNAPPETLEVLGPLCQDAHGDDAAAGPLSELPRRRCARGVLHALLVACVERLRRRLRALLADGARALGAGRGWRRTKRRSPATSAPSTSSSGSRRATPTAAPTTAAALWPAARGAALTGVAVVSGVAIGVTAGSPRRRWRAASSRRAAASRRSAAARRRSAAE